MEFTIKDHSGTFKHDMIIDTTKGTYRHEMKQDVTDLVKYCKMRRDEEGYDGHYYKHMLKDGKWKMEGCIPMDAFLGERLYERPQEDLMKWLEGHKEYKTTKAKLC